MTWDVGWRVLATVALIIVIWAGVVALAIVTALMDGKQDQPSRESTDDATAP
jgi:ABC-type lipoprotein release transport system permease subunit